MKKIITTIAIALVATTVTRADVLASWNNEALAAGATSAPVGTTHADVSSTAQTFGAGLPASNYPEALTAYGGGWGNELTQTLTGAILTNDYFTFTITPNAGKVVSYSDMFLRWTTQANAAPTNPVVTAVFTLMSSASGFTASDGIDTITLTAENAGANYGSGTFDLSGETALQSVSAGSAVEFRIYAHAPSGVMTRLGIGEAWGPDREDLILNGTVIPEPATLGLFGIAAAGMLWARKQFSI